MVTTFYRCNPELNKECKKWSCQKECTLTTHKEYARVDESGEPIIIDESEKLVTLNEIREEIEKLNPVDYGSMYSWESHKGASLMQRDVLNIIDKYSEGEE